MRKAPCHGDFFCLRAVLFKNSSFGGKKKVAIETRKAASPLEFVLYNSKCSSLCAAFPKVWGLEKKFMAYCFRDYCCPTEPDMQHFSDWPCEIRSSSRFPFCRAVFSPRKKTRLSFHFPCSGLFSCLEIGTLPSFPPTVSSGKREIGMNWDLSEADSHNNNKKARSSAADEDESNCFEHFYGFWMGRFTRLSKKMRLRNEDQGNNSNSCGPWQISRNTIRTKAIFA